MDFYRSQLIEIDLGNLLLSDKCPLDHPIETKELTRWDKFSRLKGVQKRKKLRNVWDSSTQSWKPRWGKDRIDNLKDKWVLEVPDNADPYEDQFEKLANAKSERRAKNEFQRLRNISRTVKGGQVPPIGVLTESQGSKNEFNRALAIASLSDTSMGRFSSIVDDKKQKSKNKRANLSQVASVSKRKGVRLSKKSKPMKKKGSRTGKKK